MTYKYEEELRKEAETFIEKLSRAGLDVEPHPTMFRDFLVKLAVRNAGVINIYYSPKQGTFSLKLHELHDRQLAAQIEALWNDDTSQTAESLPGQEYQAYVDGSYIDGAVGYGAVILHLGQEINRFSGSVEQDTEQRQVVGELQATMQVIAWCEQNNITEIDIFYDYEGIEKWATGAWRAKNTATQHYQDTVQASSVQVRWHKVVSHTGDHWNDIVDGLAKQAALSRNRDAAQPSDPLVALEQKVIDFLAYLSSQGVEAEYTHIYNNQCARIIIGRGYFDLYNTRKRPMSPYLHNFTDNGLQKQIEQLWKQFHLGSALEAVVSDATGFEEIEHYLSVLEPYRHLPFDFSALANALRTVIDPNHEIELPIDSYDTLERVYQQFRSKND